MSCSQSLGNGNTSGSGLLRIMGSLPSNSLCTTPHGGSLGLKCVKVLATNLPVLIAFLKKKKNRQGWESAAALYDNLTDLFFVLLLHAVHDVLKPVKQFKTYFEKDNNLPHKNPKAIERMQSSAG